MHLITGHFAFVFEKARAGNQVIVHGIIIFEKVYFWNVLRLHYSDKPAFSILRFEAPFSWRISVDGRPNRGNEAPFPAMSSA